MSSPCRSLPHAPAACALALAVLAAGCGQERRGQERRVPRGGPAVEDVRLVPLRAGLPDDRPPAPNPLGTGAATVKEGRRLYEWMNCIGCHFDGGGGMGPPLIDAKWIYGRDPAQIFDSIANGRPNGMPSFGGRLSPEEIWRIVAYVQTLAEQAPASGGGSNGGEDDGRRGGDG